jgi:hypothetical protein
MDYGGVDWEKSNIASYMQASVQSNTPWDEPQYTRSIGRFSLGRIGVGRPDTS